MRDSLNYNDLYREALVNRNYERTEREIAEAIRKAREASEALHQLTQDLSTFNLEHYRELKGKYSLENLRAFTEKAILRSGDLVMITVPEALTGFPRVAARYENVTFSRKVATRKKSVDLLGFGHPLVDALLIYLKSDRFPGELVISTGDSPKVCGRYLFTVQFDDGTVREFYRSISIEGASEPRDIENLSRKELPKPDHVTFSADIPLKAVVILKNEETKIRSSFDGVTIIRYRCVGIQVCT